MISSMYGDATLNISGEDDVAYMGKFESPAAIIKRLRKMSPKERKAWWKSLRPRQKLALAAVMPVIMPLILASVPAILPVAATAAGAKRTAKGLKEAVALLKRMKKMSPAARRAAWKKIPAAKKAILLLALPALAAVVLATAPIAAAIATTAAATPGVIPSIALARRRRLAARNARTSAALQVVQSRGTSSGIPGTPRVIVKKNAAGQLVVYKRPQVVSDASDESDDSGAPPTTTQAAQVPEQVVQQKKHTALAFGVPLALAFLI